MLQKTPTLKIKSHHEHQMVEKTIEVDLHLQLKNDPTVKVNYWKAIISASSTQFNKTIEICLWNSSAMGSLEAIWNQLCNIYLTILNEGCYS